MMIFPIGVSGQSLVFSDDVLSHFKRHRQTRFWHSEAGGLLFARLVPAIIDVVVATGPRLTDKRSRRSYVPDRRAEQKEIDDNHKRDLHFVGEWHTHPERHPSPSYLDQESMSEAVRKSRHQLNAFVLVIVGQADFPLGLHVSLFDTKTHYLLQQQIS